MPILNTFDVTQISISLSIFFLQQVKLNLDKVEYTVDLKMFMKPSPHSVTKVRKIFKQITRKSL